MSSDFSRLFETIDPLQKQFFIPVRDLELEATSMIREHESPSGPTEGRRNLIVAGRPSGQGAISPIGKVWFFSLDGKDQTGPFELVEEEVCQQEIDNRSWGIIVEPFQKIFVSVWIEE